MKKIFLWSGILGVLLVVVIGSVRLFKLNKLDDWIGAYCEKNILFLA